MERQGDDGSGFFDRYNADLEGLSIGVRISPAVSDLAGTMTILDLDGKAIGDLPKTIEPGTLATIMLLIERSFEEGVETGRALERSRD